jgi:type IV pilus assembly protein PilB
MKIARTKHGRPEVDLPHRPSSGAGDERLGALLVAASILPRSAVDAALADGGNGWLGERLVERGVVSDEALARALADHLQLNLVSFRDLTPSPEAIALMTEAQARGLGALPISIDGDTVTVAFRDPAPELVEQARSLLGKAVVPVVATISGIKSASGNAYKVTSRVESQVHAFEVQDALRREAAGLETAGASDEAPVVRVVQAIITQALRDRASDIHIEPFGDRVRVRYRIDGALNEVLNLPASIGPAVVSRVKILGGMNIVERRRPQDGQISMDIEDREVDIRVSTTAVVGGEKVVMRLLDKSRSLYQLAQLGLPEDTADKYSALLHSPYGMVICAGPTGGGKTTTLYASLAQLNSPDRNIMTIEDPVEYTFDSINQIQINEQAGITFAGGLKSILRQDPDIILVGEIRDVETARIAVQSALTGHFVLSSLHATEAVSAMYRLLDMGIEPFLIASAITAVMAQRLVRRTCNSCREAYDPSPEEIAFLVAYGVEEPVDGFVRGAGCNFCAHTGYLDRVGVYELLYVTDEVRELILDRAPHDEMRKLARQQGMFTLQEQAVRLVNSGVTTASEVMRSIYVAGV